MKHLFVIICLLFITLANAQKVHRHYGKSYNDNPNSVGLGLTIGGGAFTAAAILEGGYSYGTYKINPANPYGANYVIPPIWQQTPRNIMLLTGITLTITGLITKLANK